MHIIIHGYWVIVVNIYHMSAYWRRTIDANNSVYCAVRPFLVLPDIKTIVKRFYFSLFYLLEPTLQRVYTGIFHGNGNRSGIRGWDEIVNVN